MGEAEAKEMSEEGDREWGWSRSSVWLLIFDTFLCQTSMDIADGFLI